MNPFVSLGMLHARADWSILTNRICYYSNHCANWVSGSLSHTTAQIWCKQKQIKGRVGTEVPIAWFISNKKNITFWYITWKWMCESLNLIGNITDEMYVCVCVWNAHYITHSVMSAAPLRLSLNESSTSASVWEERGVCVRPKLSLVRTRDPHTTQRLHGLSSLPLFVSTCLNCACNCARTHLR